jgi:ribosomal-protein-alanine N-acetyltransferase
MMGFANYLFTRRMPMLSEAGPHDAADIAALHAASFNRGWSDEEIEHMLIDRDVLGHRARACRQHAGFILALRLFDEAEILSVAVAAAHRSRGLARTMLDVHLQRLAWLGARAVFLEVGEDNAPARRLYQRAGFREVGRREGYYPDDAGNPTAALVLRRDL